MCHVSQGLYNGRLSGHEPGVVVLVLYSRPVQPACPALETRVQLTLLVQSACLWLALNTLCLDSPIVMVRLRSYSQTVELLSSYNTPALCNSNSHCRTATMAGEKLTATELQSYLAFTAVKVIRVRVTPSWPTETTVCSSSDSDYSLQAGAPPTGHGPGRLSANPHLLLHN